MRHLSAVLVLLCDNCLAALTEQHIAAIEDCVLPLFVIKGEPAPVVPLAKRMEQLKVHAVSVAVFDDGKVLLIDLICLAWASKASVYSSRAGRVVQSLLGTQIGASRDRPGSSGEHC
jgi:hypothetical protein